MGVIRDLSGQRFGHLTVKFESERRSFGNVVWVCKCDCGKYINARSGGLVRGSTKSCGCLRGAKGYVGPSTAGLIQMASRHLRRAELIAKAGARGDL